MLDDVTIETHREHENFDVLINRDYDFFFKFV